jgi:hypothetical protein
MAKKTNDQELSELCTIIAKEHYDLTKDHKGDNINYLWYMYSEGVHRGVYRPFILMAEMNLCKCFQLITEDECQNLLNMLKSEDKDNAYLAMLVVKKIMQDRHDKYGNDLSKSVYLDIKKDYHFRVISHDLFMKTKSF